MSRPYDWFPTPYSHKNWIAWTPREKLRVGKLVVLESQYDAQVRDVIEPRRPTKEKYRYPMS